LSLSHLYSGLQSEVGPVYHERLTLGQEGLKPRRPDAEERGEDGAAKRASRALFGAQLLLNVLWTYVFFGRRAPGWAFVEVVFLLAAIAATAVSFSKVSRTAALLLVPYLLWTGFASVLNFCVWRLNR
jgi:tryptophan-rich sensory protein